MIGLVSLACFRQKRETCTITETLAGILYPPISISLLVRLKVPVAVGWRRNVSFKTCKIKTYEYMIKHGNHDVISTITERLST